MTTDLETLPLILTDSPVGFGKESACCGAPMTVYQYAESADRENTATICDACGNYAEEDEQ